MRYPKEHIKPDGRKLVAGGPRDMQRRQQVVYTTSPDAELIESLKQQIEELKAVAQSAKSSETLYTAEELDEEIRKAVEAAVKETTLALKKSAQIASQEVEPLVQKYKSQIVELQKNNDDLIKLHTSITNQNSELKSKISQLEQEVSEVNELKKQIAVLEQALAGKEEVIAALKSRITTEVGVEAEVEQRPKIERVFVDPLDKSAEEGLKSNINVEELQVLDKKEDIDDKVNKLRSLLGKLPTKK